MPSFPRHADFFHPFVGSHPIIKFLYSNRLKIRMKQNAIAENITAQEQAEAEKAEKQKKRMGAINTGKPKDE